MVENIKLENTVSGSVLELSSTTTPYYILEHCIWSSIESERYEYKYINQIGVQVTNTTLETRDVEIAGWIIADNSYDMTQRKRFLNKFVSPLQPLRLYYKGSYLDFIPETTIKYETDREGNNEVIVHFEITGVAPNPLFKDATSTSLANATYQPAFMFPLIFIRENEYNGVIFGVKDEQKSYLFNVYNAGDIVIGMKIRFRSLQGEVENPSITNVANQTYVKINKTLEKDEQVIINTNVGYKSITGKKVSDEGFSNYFQYRDINSAWLQLEVGDNILIYGADLNTENLEVLIEYNNSYLEVQQWD